MVKKIKEDEIEEDSYEESYIATVKCKNCGEKVNYTIPKGKSIKLFLFNNDDKCKRCKCFVNHF